MTISEIPHSIIAKSLIVVSDRSALYIVCLLNFQHTYDL